MNEGFNLPNDPSLVHSSALLRGEVSAFIANKAVTLPEIVKQFGQANTTEALNGLWDRNQIEVSNGRYFLTSPDVWRPLHQLRFRRGSR
jgi:hypothetical protein